MPRGHPIPSLREAGLINIASHFENYWCAGNTATLLEASRLLYVIGPFEYLRGDMIQELLGILVKKGLLRRHHFHLLLHSHLRHLNLNICRAVANHSSVIDMVSVRCQRLTHLDLEGLNSVQPKVLCKLVASLPEIVSLILTSTKTDGQVLKTVANSCPNLLELDVSWCRLQDTGFQHFCNLANNFSQVPQLKRLIFRGIWLSLDMVVALLKSQKKLQTLGECFIVDSALDRMYGEGFLELNEVLPEWKNNLSELSIIRNPVENLNLCEGLRFELVFKCCPFLTKLDLNNLTENTSLKHVSKLKHLKSLQVSLHKTHTKVSFKSDIVPILKELGGNLTSLGLHELFEVDVITVGMLCPYLESLDLGLTRSTHVDHYPSPDYPVACFTRLKELQIVDDTDSLNAISEVELSAILVNAAELTKLELTCVTSLTEGVITKADEKHRFSYLEVAKFHDCNSITKETGMALLNSNNPLKELSFLNCRNVTRQDVDRFQQDCKQRNLNIKIAWK